MMGRLRRAVGHVPCLPSAQCFTPRTAVHRFHGRLENTWFVPQSRHTQKYLPWKLVGYHAFGDKKMALDFETCLKSGSGKAFASKRFWK